jgi:hypothetical protein
MTRLLEARTTLALAKPIAMRQRRVKFFGFWMKSLPSMTR